jgi:hypothetical protein
LQLHLGNHQVMPKNIMVDHHSPAMFWWQVGENS